MRTLSLHFDRVETVLGADRDDTLGLELRRARAALDLVLATGARMRQGMLPASEPAVCDAALVVETTARIAERASRHPIRVRVAIESRPRARIDATSLASIVFNLVSNAVHAIGEAGALADAEVSVALATRDHEAVLTVADTGPGIAPEHLARVFDPGFTTRPDGTGLGLATVRDLVEAAGGSVTVRSEPGRGAVFEAHVPLVEHG